MLVFDQLKKSDPQLRAIAVAILAGLGALLAGLWWVQIVSARDYQAVLENQSFRTVRIPAVRGQILDRNRAVLAENRPTYSVSLYLEELRKDFDATYFKQVSNKRIDLKRQIEEEEKRVKRKLTRQERKTFALKAEDKSLIRQQARYEVASNVVLQVGYRLRQDLSLDPVKFEQHYDNRLALPYRVIPNLDPTNIARFEEQSISPLGVDLEAQSTRIYPNQSLAAHVLGFLRRNDDSVAGEEAFFSYRLPDFQGVLGIEAGCDKDLRGQAGAKTVLVNNVGYRTTESVWNPADPGHNVILSLDLEIQKAAERALPVFGPNTRGAAVVMDVETGDILAMASCPTFNPNYYVQGFPPGEIQRMKDLTLRPQINRATQENYAPGSIFKTVVGLAALEAGLDPNESIYNPGLIYVGRRAIHDLAPPGDYNFKRALKVSSNTYFITNGMKAGIENIVRLGQQLHLGERTGLPTRQEVSGVFPTLAKVEGWPAGETANICIGQGQLSVTPLQMAVAISAFANGGKVLFPRLVQRIETQDPSSGEPATVFEGGRVRSYLGVKPQNLRILHEAMLADVEDPDGTGKNAALPGFRICGKTGTAQIMNDRNQLIGHTLWFASFGPFEKPRYAVVVMVEAQTAGSGGTTCAPVAKHIYAAILDQERRTAGTKATMASNN